MSILSLLVALASGKNWELSSMTLLVRRMKIVVTGQGEGGGGHQMDEASLVCFLGQVQELCSTFSAV